MFYGVIGQPIRKIYVGLIFGLTIGIYNYFNYSYIALDSSIKIGLILGSLIYGGVSGFFFGLVFGDAFHPTNGFIWIETKDMAKWSLRNFCQHFIRNWKIVLVFLLSYPFIRQLPFVLTNNEWHNAEKFFAVFFGFYFVLSYGLISMLRENHTSILQISHPYQRFKASYKSLHFSILQHKHLCWLLSRRGLLPRNLVAFLNEMTERHLLESDGAIFDDNGKITKSGATWRFRHRILQEYFAEQWKEPEN